MNRAKIGWIPFLPLLGLWLPLAWAAEDPHEPNDSRETATPILAGSGVVQEHRFRSNEDVDWIRLWVERDGFYQIEIPEATVAADADPVIELIAETGESLLFNPVDNGLEGQGETLGWTAELDGFVYLLMSHENAAVSAGADSRYGVRVTLPIAPQTGFLQGAVRSACDQAPIPWAQITTDPAADVRSQPDGRYGLPLYAGDYRVRVAASGYQAGAAAASVAENQASRLNFELTPLAGCAVAAVRPEGLTASDGDYSDRVRVDWSETADATAYEVYRCTSPSSGSCTRTGATTAGGFDDTAVQPGSTYYFRAKACQDGNCSDFSPQDSGYAEDVAAALPAGPATIGADAGAYADRIGVRWSAADGLNLYSLYRCTGLAQGACGLIAETAGTAHADAPLPAGSAYYYRVRGCNGARCSDLSAAARGYTAAEPVCTPGTARIQAVVISEPRDYCATEAIEIGPAAILQPDADVTAAAPQIRLLPEVRILAGAGFRAQAGSTP